MRPFLYARAAAPEAGSGEPRPTGHGLKPLDIEVMKRLSSRVNLIPVIAKADTLSPNDLLKFKSRVGFYLALHFPTF